MLCLCVLCTFSLFIGYVKSVISTEFIKHIWSLSYANLFKSYISMETKPEGTTQGMPKQDLNNIAAHIGYDTGRYAMVGWL